jgi:lipopolysaccharide transport system permease protein
MYETSLRDTNQATNPHESIPTSLVALGKSLLSNRELIIRMIRREVTGRYKGSILGMTWSFFNPLIMLGVYTFVFSFVFKARWGVDTDESKTSFAIILFVGMIVHGLFAECVNRAPGLILANVNYVKKVVFPLEILSWVAMGSALFNAVVSLTVLMFAQLLASSKLPYTAVFFPAVILPLVFATMGFTWFLSATGVFVRDIGQTAGIITTIMLFISPVFYPLSALPNKYQILLLLNPLSFIIEQARRVLIWGKLPDWIGLLFYFAISVLIAWAGFWWFQRTRRGFADVL